MMMKINPPFLLLFLATFVGTRAFVPFTAGHNIRTTVVSQLKATTDDAAFMDALRQRLEAGPFRLLLPPTTTSAPPPSMYYIIKLNQKGVHSIEYPQGSGNNVVLAFCDATACRKFAENLRQQSFFDPVVQPILPTTLHAFCHRQGVYYHTVPEGVDLIPPQHAVKEIGRHNTDRSFREQLNYVYSMMVDELEEDGVIVPSSSSAGAGENPLWMSVLE